MGQWSLKERLQPSLLDRLTDDRPEKTRESQADQTLSQADIKRAVIRDLGYLFNSVNLECVQDLEAWPDAQRSTINYGVPELSGHTASSVKLGSLEREIRQAIIDYEPRIIRNSLRVRIKSDPDSMSHNTLTFEIQGAIFGQPAPFQVMLLSKLDVESGDFRVAEG